MHSLLTDMNLLWIIHCCKAAYVSGVSLL